jgi:hypothetical protein
MRVAGQNRYSGGGSSIMNRDDPNPHETQQKLEALEARLSHQENKTLRAMILSIGLAGLATILVVAHILVS